MSSSFGKVLVIGLILTGMMKARTAGAIDLIDTPTLLGPYGSSYPVNPNEPAGQSFTTTSSGYVLNEVSLRLFRNVGDSGTYSVSIYTASGSGVSMLPGSLVTNIVTNQDMVSGANAVPVSVNGDGSDVSSISFTGLNISLNSTPTDYFVIVSYSGSYYLSWAAVATISPPTFNGNSTYGFLTVQGTPTNIGDNDPALLKVVAGTNVPEPSTWALGALAVAGLAASARRRRAQA